VVRCQFGTVSRRNASRFGNAQFAASLRSGGPRGRPCRALHGGPRARGRRGHEGRRYGYPEACRFRKSCESLPDLGEEPVYFLRP